MTFSEASRRFGGNAIPIGVVRAAPEETASGGKQGKQAAAAAGETVILSPSPDLVIEGSDKMILLANDAKDTRVTRPTRAPKQLAGLASSEEADGKGGKKPKSSAAAAMQANAPLRILLLNDDPTMPDVIDQIDEVSAKGSSITLLAPERPTVLSRTLSHASLSYIKGDPASPESIKSLNPEDYDAVVLLQPGSGSDADDSKLLVSLLSLQQAARDKGVAVPRIVAEVHSPSMLDLISSRWPGEGDKWDFVLPNELCAGILVQFALQPDLRPVYSELLQPDGKEFFLQPASIYCMGDKAVAEGTKAVSFEALSASARARGEVAIGVHRAGEKRPTLNPPRSMKLKLKDGDQLVVLGDSF